MKIVFLDAKTIGDDIDLSAFEKLGEVVTYNFSTTEEALERTITKTRFNRLSMIYSPPCFLRFSGPKLRGSSSSSVCTS